MIYEDYHLILNVHRNLIDSVVCMSLVWFIIDCAKRSVANISYIISNYKEVKQGKNIETVVVSTLNGIGSGYVFLNHTKILKHCPYLFSSEILLFWKNFKCFKIFVVLNVNSPPLDNDTINMHVIPNFKTAPISLKIEMIA